MFFVIGVKTHRIIMPMEKAEIKQIADYLKDLEEGLYERDYRGITKQGHLTKLYYRSNEANRVKKIICLC